MDSSLTNVRYLFEIILNIKFKPTAIYSSVVQHEIHLIWCFLFYFYSIIHKSEWNLIKYYTLIIIKYTQVNIFIYVLNYVIEYNFCNVYLFKMFLLVSSSRILNEFIQLKVCNVILLLFCLELYLSNVIFQFSLFIQKLFQINVL